MELELTMLQVNTVIATLALVVSMFCIPLGDLAGLANHAGGANTPASAVADGGGPMPPDFPLAVPGSVSTSFDAAA